MHIELQHWPFYSQLHDWTADAQPDENRLNNCGPECLAMVTKYLTDVELPADFIKDVLYGESFQGYTSQEKQIYWLRKYCNTGSDIYTYPVTASFGSSSVTAMFHKWDDELLRGHPLIHLRSFSGPNKPDGHFECGIGSGKGYKITADPWTGQRRVWSDREFWDWSKGTFVRANRIRCNRW